MHQNRRKDENGQMLHRIVALLFALADLAEAASLRSDAVRKLVLWLLYPAEAIARDFVLDAYGPVTLPASRVVGGTDGPAEAIHLACCFRVLGMILASLPEELFESRTEDPTQIECMIFSVGALSMLAAASLSPGRPARPWPDTS